MGYACFVALSTTAYYNTRMKKLPPTSIRYDPDVREFLERLAEEEERPIGQIVNRALREHFGIPKPAKPKAVKGK